MTARDVVVVSVILLVTALFLFIGNYLTNTIMDVALTHSELNSSPGAVNSYNSVKTQANKLDYVYFAYFIGLVIGIIITGWLIGGNPIFMFFYIIILIFGVLISPILSNTFESFIATPAISATLSNFPIMTFIMQHLPMLMTIIGMLGLLVMFAKPNIVGGNQYQ